MARVYILHIHTQHIHNTYTLHTNDSRYLYIHSGVVTLFYVRLIISPALDLMSFLRIRQWCLLPSSRQTFSSRIAFSHKHTHTRSVIFNLKFYYFYFVMVMLNATTNALQHCTSCVLSVGCMYHYYSSFLHICIFVVPDKEGIKWKEEKKTEHSLRMDCEDFIAVVGVFCLP